MPAKKKEEKEEYQDADNDWEDETSKFIQEESDVRHVVRDFTGGTGISGKTDLTPIQGVLLTQFRLLQEDYHKRFPGLNLDKLPQWFEIYRLSIGRGSRKETVDILKGKLDINPPAGGQLPGPGLPGRW